MSGGKRFGIESFMGKLSLHEEQVKLPDIISIASSSEISKWSCPLQMGHTKMFINSFFKSSSFGLRISVS
jgi:hypothetical protein